LIHHRKKSILYVDDTVEQRYAMRRILETEGYSVLEAGSGREALEMVAKSPALAVVDVRLPDIDGYDLTRKIKERAPFLPILQVSASFSDPHLRASGLSGGANAYIAQPVHPSELIALVRRMLQTVEAEESLRFLAGVGPQLSASLSLSVASESICNAITPYFSDHCILLLTAFPGSEGQFWSSELKRDDPSRQILLEHAEANTVTLVNSRFLIASLFVGKQSFGAIAFLLNSEREYTDSDRILAADLASRAALALQNCMLLAKEQATRTALIQAEKLATAGRMAAAIAHEVNNPLEALTNLVYLLERSPEATPSVREIAASALGEITRVAHITRQTLGFYRELRTPAALNLSQSVAETLDLYRKRLSDRSLSFEMDLADDVMIRGIKGEIQQVISNLLVNAFEATESGGVIALRTRASDGKAILTISDDGPGINATLLPKIFEAFYTTKQATGTGLGLWITRNIVEKHGGAISVSSSTSPQNRGTKFTLEFPLQSSFDGASSNQNPSGASESVRQRPGNSGT
jgi:two-component system NtrC family sensor kinase